MVAACIRADTGVGPAMASGSQTWRGNWALFPIAPMKRPRPAQNPKVARRLPVPAATASMMSVKRNEPTDIVTMITPTKSPTSATLLVRNALIPAEEFSCCSQ